MSLRARIAPAIVGAILLFPVAALSAQGSATTPARPLSLEDALGLAAGSSESVGLARAGLTRARGQQYQARSAILPQVTTGLNYQRQLQNQFQAISRRTGGGNTGGGGGDSTLADNPLTRMHLAVRPLAQPPFPMEWLSRL